MLKAFAASAIAHILAASLPAMTTTVMLMPALTTAATPGEPQHRSLLGTWEIDPSASHYKGRAPLKNGTMRFEALPKGAVHVICDVTTSSGIPFHFEYQGPEDGSVHPVSGNPYYDSESTAWSGPGTVIRTE